MNVEHVPVDSVRLDPRNVRTHPDRNLDAIRESLERFGQQKPIVVDRDGMVVAGNGTVQALRDMGADTVSVVRTTLTAQEARAYAVADNRTAELAEWDWPELSSLLAELDEQDALDGLGFADHELDPLLNAEWEPPPIDPDPDPVGPAGSVIVRFTTDGWGDVEAAIEHVRSTVDPGMDDATALAHVCREWLDG